jgi:hypothetical protein
MVYYLFMVVRRAPLFNKKQTGKAMYGLVRRFSGDLKNVFLRDGSRVVSANRIPLPRWFDFVKNIPYRCDPKPREIVARPSHIINYGSVEHLGADCKKKAILIASWLRQNHVPFTFVSASRLRNGRIHHVFVRAFPSGGSVDLDATYKRNTIGMRRRDTKQEILTP